MQPCKKFGNANSSAEFRQLGQGQCEAEER
jgi:hypothetical protein